MSQPGAHYPSEWAACQRCGRIRMVNRSRPAPLCRDCRPPEANCNALAPCPDCGRVMVSGGLRRHRGSTKCLPQLVTTTGEDRP
jgi:hypothetical protein